MDGINTNSIITENHGFLPDTSGLLIAAPCCGNFGVDPNIKKPDDPEIWGPLLWKILYFLLYKINTKNNIIKYLIILNNLNNILPCSICNNHVNQYISREPLLTIDKDKDYTVDEINSIKLKIFFWLRKLQNIIRFNKKKEILNFTLESLEEYYKTVTITSNSFRSIFSIFALSNNVQISIRPHLKEWLKILEELRLEIVG